MKEFNVGDRVYYVYDDAYSIGESRDASHKEGVICGVNHDGSIGICFDDYVDGHDLDGLCEWGYGFWVKKETLTHIDDTNMSIESDALELILGVGI